MYNLTVKPKNIVLISAIQIHPAESGGQLRSHNICSALADLGHNVCAYSFTGRRDDYTSFHSSFYHNITKNFSEFVNMSWFNAIFQLLSYRLALPPFWITFLLFFFIPKRLKTLIKNSDIVILDFPFLYPIIKICNFKKVILNTHNAEFELYNSGNLKDRYLKTIVKKIEISALLLIDTVLFCSQNDYLSFSNLGYTPKKYYLLSNGVDISSYVRNDSIRQKLRSDLLINKDTQLVLFTGSQFLPNKEAFSFLQSFIAQNHILLKKFKIVFLVVGSISDHAFRDDNLIVTGKVPKIVPYFHASDFAINPVNSGSGTNVKMMEYLAAKLPIFSSNFGTRGLNLIDKKSCFIFNESNLTDVIRDVFINFTMHQLRTMTTNAYKENINVIDIKHAISKLDCF